MDIEKILTENQISVLDQIDKINQRELKGLRCQNCICKTISKTDIIKSCEVPSCYNKIEKGYSVCKECSSEMGLCEVCGEAIHLEIDANVIIDRVERYIAILKDYKGLILSAYNSNTDLISLNLAIEYTMRDFCLDEYQIMKVVEGYEF